MRQEADANRPYFAHIFKYKLAGLFPVINVDLKYFCLRINSFNLEMVKNKKKFYKQNKKIFFIKIKKISAQTKTKIPFITLQGLRNPQ